MAAKSNIFLFGFLIVAFAGVLCQAEPSADCAKALYRGLMTLDAMTNKVLPLARDQKISHEDLASCEVLEFALSTVLSEFYSSGCGWGIDNDVFEARALSLLKNLFNEDCDIFAKAADDDQVSDCSPVDELVSGVSSVAFCGAHVVIDEYDGRANRLDRDVCRAVKNFAPCLENSVDICYSGGATPSDAILEVGGAAAVVQVAKSAQDFARFAEEYEEYYGEARANPALEVAEQFNTCSDEELGWTTILKGFDLDWQPSEDALPSDEEIVEMLSEVTRLTVNEEYGRQLAQTMEDEIFNPIGEMMYEAYKARREAAAAAPAA